MRCIAELRCIAERFSALMVIVAAVLGADIAVAQEATGTGGTIEIVEIRVHGNHSVTDEEVLATATVR